MLRFKKEANVKEMGKTANIITVFRIILSIFILIFPSFTPAFYVLYVSAGVTDMLDGIVARKTNSVSELGSRLDTVADFVLVTVCLIKLLPLLSIPIWLWIWMGVIAAIKIANVVSGFVLHRKFVAVHMAANKITGLMLFLLPLSLNFIELKYSSVVICAAATLAAIQEGRCIRTGKIKYS